MANNTRYRLAPAYRRPANFPKNFLPVPREAVAICGERLSPTLVIAAREADADGYLPPTTSLARVSEFDHHTIGLNLKKLAALGIVDLEPIRPKTPRTKRPIPAPLRWSVWERDNFTCQACGSRQRLAVDHIHPESKGGTLDLDNLQTLCVPCNTKKGAT